MRTENFNRSDNRNSGPYVCAVYYAGDAEQAGHFLAPLSKDGCRIQTCRVRLEAAFDVLSDEDMKLIGNCSVCILFISNKALSVLPVEDIIHSFENRSVRRIVVYLEHCMLSKGHQMLLGNMQAIYAERPNSVRLLRVTLPDRVYRDNRNPAIDEKSRRKPLTRRTRVIISLLILSSAALLGFGVYSMVRNHAASQKENNAPEAAVTRLDPSEGEAFAEILTAYRDTDSVVFPDPENEVNLYAGLEEISELRFALTDLDHDESAEMLILGQVEEDQPVPIELVMFSGGEPRQYGETLQIGLAYAFRHMLNLCDNGTLLIKKTRDDDKFQTNIYTMRNGFLTLSDSFFYKSGKYYHGLGCRVLETIVEDDFEEYLDTRENYKDVIREYALVELITYPVSEDNIEALKAGNIGTLSGGEILVQTPIEGGGS